MHHGELTAEQAERYRVELREVEEWDRWNAIYREHIRTTIPPR